jgi:hypothetical protein
MSAAPALIQRIVEDAGIVSLRRRRDLERELAAHLEDLSADLHGEELAIHFGDPGEIAQAFTRVYRPERVAFYAAGICLLAAVSWTASAAIVGAVQFLLARLLGFSAARLFSPEHLLWETIQMAALTLGCLGIHYSQRLFVRKRLAKASALVGTVFALSALALELSLPGHGRVLLMAFLWAFLVSILAPHRLLWILGAALFAVLGLAFAHATAQALFASIWIALAVCCQLTLVMAGAFDRHILRRQSA